MKKAVALLFFLFSVPRMCVCVFVCLFVCFFCDWEIGFLLCLFVCLASRVLLDVVGRRSFFFFFFCLFVCSVLFSSCWLGGFFLLRSLNQPSKRQSTEEGEVVGHTRHEHTNPAHTQRPYNAYRREDFCSGAKRYAFTYTQGYRSKAHTHTHIYLEIYIYIS